MGSCFGQGNFLSVREQKEAKVESGGEVSSLARPPHVSIQISPELDVPTSKLWLALKLWALQFRVSQAALKALCLVLWVFLAAFGVSESIPKSPYILHTRLSLHDTNDAQYFTLFLCTKPLTAEEVLQYQLALRQ